MEITASKPRRGAIPALFFFYSKKYTAQRITPALCGRFFICREKIMRLNRFTAFLFLPACDSSRKTENASKGI